jgi:nudix-type nucleoside diphosphatase (YffH/AdpP family)
VEVGDRSEIMAAEIVRTEVVYSGWTKLAIATVRLPQGQIVRREIEDHGSAVCVLPYNPERKTAVLVRQFRAPVFLAERQEETLEAIAGVIEEADPKESVRREALEEAELALGELEHVLTGWTMPGISMERMHFYLAVYRDQLSGKAAGSEASEPTAPVEVGLGELAEMADSGRLVDVKTMLLVQTLRIRLPSLFAR